VAAAVASQQGYVAGATAAIATAAGAAATGSGSDAHTVIVSQRMYVLACVRRTVPREARESQYYVFFGHTQSGVISSCCQKQGISSMCHSNQYHHGSYSSREAACSVVCTVNVASMQCEQERERETEQCASKRFVQRLCNGHKHGCTLKKQQLHCVWGAQSAL
jgi:hypothetical protein